MKTRLALLPLSAGIVSLVAAAIQLVKTGGSLDVQILDHYFVVSPLWLLIGGAVLVVSSLTVLAIT